MRMAFWISSAVISLVVEVLLEQRSSTCAIVSSSSWRAPAAAAA